LSNQVAKEYGNITRLQNINANEKIKKCMMRTAHESQPFVNLYKLLQTELNLTIFENKYELRHELLRLIKERKENVVCFITFYIGSGVV
jgi:hypothetical protein